MLKERLSKLLAYAKAKEVNYLLIKGARDLYYYTGMNLSEGVLLVGKEASLLYVDARYFESCKAKLSSLFNEVCLWKRDDQAINDRLRGLSVGLDPSIVMGHEWLDYQGVFGDNLIALDSGSMSILRMQKDAAELKIIKDASQATTKGLQFIVDHLKTGIQEKWLCQALKVYWLQEFGASPAFDPIIAFGENSANPHYTPGTTSLKEGDFVLIDLGAKLNGYCSDMTRTFYWKQKSTEQERIYTSVLQAYLAAFDGFSIEKSGKDLDTFARDCLQEKGYADAFCHSLGHGVGLLVHERPNLSSRSKDLLPEGCVFTIEPGVYVPGLGGVRIEDTIVVKQGKLEIMTPFTKDPNL